MEDGNELVWYEIGKFLRFMGSIKVLCWEIYLNFARESASEKRLRKKMFGIKIDTKVCMIFECVKLSSI